MRRLVLSLALAAASIATVTAQPRLAADLNTTGSSTPDDVVLYDGRVFFAATNRNVGRELWAFDPETEQLELAADILPSANFYSNQGSFPYGMTVLGDELFFGIVSETGRELWAYRADTGQARHVSDVAPGLFYIPTPGEAGPGYLTPFDGRLYYVGFREDVGSAIWVYDPATDAVTVAADVADGFGGSLGPGHLAAYDGRIYFSAAAGNSANRLAVFDLATGQTEPVAFNGDGSNPRDLTVYDGRLYFTAGSSNDRALWALDAGGVTLAHDVSGEPRHLTVFDDRLYFSDTDPDDVFVSALWATDGETVEVVSRTLLRTAPVAYDGRLFFGAVTNDTGEELWSFDPETGQAALVADLAPGGGNGPRSSFPADLVAAGGRLYFAATENQVDDRELWAYDAATDQATLAADIESSESSSPRYLVELDGQLYFGADADGGSRSELWTFDPVTDRAALVGGIAPEETGISPWYLTAHQGALYFSADVPNASDYGRELWTHDPATGETRLAADLAPGPDDGSPQDLTSYAGRLYFSAYTPATGQELWAYDDGASQATLAADIKPGSASGFPFNLTVAGGLLYFTASDDAHGTEVWVYDAATGQATLALDAVPGPDGSDPQWLAAYAGDVVMQRSRGFGVQPPPGLWVIDPESGATRFTDLGLLPLTDESARFDPPVVYDGRLFFGALDAENEAYGVWAYDDATGAADRIDAFDSLDRVRLQLVYEDRLYARGRTPETGTELWAYDATDASLDLISDLAPGPDDGGGSDLAIVDGRLFFNASDGLRGNELWVYDGLNGVASDAPVRATRRLSAPSPNPTRGAARFTVQMPQLGDVRVTLHDMLGRELARLHDGPLTSGSHAFTLDAAAVPSGVYVVRAVGAGLREARTLTVVR